VKARLVADDEAGRALAVNVLCRGGIVAMPTDTVYGVGVALDAERGLERLFAAKDRPLDKRIVLLVADAAQAETVGVLTPAARALAERFWPGGLTLVLAEQAEARLPAVLTAGQATIGLRMPDHECPRALAREFGPLPVTSANLSGQPAATTAEEAVAQLGERIDLILDGGTARGGVPSTVVDCSGEEPRVLRMGAIEPGPLVDALARVLGAGSANLYAGEAAGIRAVGLDVAVQAASRVARRATGRSAELGRALEPEEWDGPDFWAWQTGWNLGRGDPELGWDFVCRLIDAVAHDEGALSLVGAGQLEDFCRAAAPAFIDRIEERARTNRAFRSALGEVWPGAEPPPDAWVPDGYVRGGPRIPPEIYARMRRAAGVD
jgi:L-threonylcarbamoyladenylate synthase